MIIIPAVDIRDGKCVRLDQGDAARQTLYDQDPVDAALRWQKQGATRLHIVDLDGAFEGKLKNAPTVKRIVDAVVMHTELGGGLRNDKTVRQAFDMGVDTVILGTAAFTDKEFLRRTLDRYADKVLVGIDARDGFVCARGWKDALGVRAIDAASEMRAMGAGGLVCTDVRTDGMLTGPNFSFLKEMQDAAGIPIIASGGVSTLQDIRALARMKVFGAIVGKALYEGRFNVTEAIRACSASA